MCQPEGGPERQCSIDDQGVVMNRIHRASGATLTAAVCAAVLAGAATVPATAALASATTASAAAAKSGICTSAKHPRLAARISRGISSVLADRTGSVVGLAASDAADGLTCALRQSVHFYAASVIKATIISALLLKEGGPKHLTTAQRDLAYLMITQSSNSAATSLWDEVGISHMQHFLNEARMRQTLLSDAWGLTLITPHDELRLLHLLTTKGKVLGNSSRGYVLWLMSKVIASERWGVSAGAPQDVTVHIKNGWLPFPGANDWNINSIGAFTGKGIGYQIVILTAPPSRTEGQGESYGIQTIEDAASVINRELAGKSASSSLPPPDDAQLGAPGG
jgi:Beta-lactamase enzyme family